MPARKATIKVSTRGYVVVPKRLIQAIGVNPGEKLVARVEEGKIVIEKPAE
ncbi:MAG: hypothetical protein DRO40_01760 [Thermoprotei archaeon]|nr:MAG: hypothetical protein DRO40_01760 [Thermoprotei archaeon]